MIRLPYFPPFVVLCLAVASLAGNVFACACCAEPGTYWLHTLKTYSYRMDLINDVRFARKANLYMTEAGFEAIRGLDRVQKEDDAMTASITEGFDLSVSLTSNRTWIFGFGTPNGVKGSLTLPVPRQMDKFAVDIHDNENDGLGPLLYKEFRFRGHVAAASGFTGSGAARGTTFFLVLQGRGRGCDEVGDFKNWRLEIEGPRAAYAFFGKLVAPAPSLDDRE